MTKDPQIKIDKLGNIIFNAALLDVLKITRAPKSYKYYQVFYDDQETHMIAIKFVELASGHTFKMNVSKYMATSYFKGFITQTGLNLPQKIISVKYDIKDDMIFVDLSPLLKKEKK